MFKAYIIAKTPKRSAETIYRVFRFLDAGYSISEYYENYRANKSRSGRKPIVLPNDELEYIKEKIALGWTPDTIIGRNEKHIVRFIVSLNALRPRCDLAPNEGEKDIQMVTLNAVEKLDD